MEAKCCVYCEYKNTEPPVCEDCDKPIFDDLADGKECYSCYYTTCAAHKDNNKGI